MTALAGRIRSIPSWQITLGLALIILVRYRVAVGFAVAAFFIAVFPGNVSQLVTHTDAFGLSSDLARGIRLVFQPLLVVWALWSTGAWGWGMSWWRERRTTSESRPR